MKALLDNWQFWLLGAPYYHALMLVLCLVAIWLLVKINRKLNIVLNYLHAIWRDKK